MGFARAANLMQHAPLLLPSPADAAPPDLRRGSIFFVGTATVIIRYAGFTILTDPNFLHKGGHVHLRNGHHSGRPPQPPPPPRRSAAPASRSPPTRPFCPKAITSTSDTASTPSGSLSPPSPSTSFRRSISSCFLTCT